MIFRQLVISDYPKPDKQCARIPDIFRGALDCGASNINDTRNRQRAPLQNLPMRWFLDRVKEAYRLPEMAFGKEYILPKPMDPRLLLCVPPAVAMAAMQSGVSRRPIDNWDKYREMLIKLGKQCSDGVCYSQLLNSRDTLARIAKKLGYEMK